MKKLAENHPIAYGIIFGYGLSLLFILVEFFFTLPNSPTISEYWEWIDSCVRIVFAILALISLKVFYKDRFKTLFTHKIPTKTWLWCIPFAVYLIVEFMYFAVAKATTMQYLTLFFAVCVSQIATGLWEESASRGLIMCGMLDKWKNSTKGRIGMVLISGVLFGTLHTFGVIYGNGLVDSLWQTLYTTTWGMFIAAIYLYSENLLFCMSLHAVWDIVVKIPNYFCAGVNDGIILSGIHMTEDIIQLVILPVIAIVICVRYKETLSEDNV